MYSKALFALAAASVVGQAIAAIHPQHGHQHLHQNQKKALVTEVVTVTDWVTVTIADAPTSRTFMAVNSRSRKSRSRKPTLASSSSSAKSTSSSAPPAPTVAAAAAPTTIVTQVKPSVEAAPSIPAAAPAPAIESPAAAAPPAVSAAAAPITPPVQKADPPAVVPTPAAPAPSAPAVQAPAVAPAPAASPNPAPVTPIVSAPASGGNKRGLAYNDGTLLPSFMGSGTHVSWAYNWGQWDDSGSIGVEYVPMVWGMTKGFPQSWSANARKCISKGSKHLLSFNEPDNGGQATMSPGDAASAHISVMREFAGQVRIGSPAITNSNQPGEGIEWLRAFFKACNGNCPIDFIPIHIYGVNTETFLNHVKAVHSEFKLPIWITEFAFDGDDEWINTQLKTVMQALDNDNSVERYSYFMASQGRMVRGNSLSAYGSTFAYGS
ncbi:glycosyl hydrolase catalytic core-domain-containing protein [Podospora didyma]|uniref:Glycosyl hydrolase catalytic core-domain-containing protein n=1 Tax=Podospora didyma TaxID=330526 RepID=A0AAE0NU37_9PEZI|nr:glycosyl hydrolase catalytic core-domain-containing protein [Podospora didyma]